MWYDKFLIAALAMTLAACGGTETDGEGQCVDVDTSGCGVTLSPSGGDDTKAVQTAFIEARSGDDICFCPGDYAFTKELSLTVPNVTVRGLGADRQDTVLDFGGQIVGDDGVTVTSDGFTIENLWVKNTPGNGIVVTGVDDVVFQNLKVSWDAGSVLDNGAYAVYPTKSNRVVVENVEVVGASDAGIYVGQCSQAIVRDSLVYGNVGGIQIENTTDSEVVNNEAYDNTSGILIFVLPNLEKKDGVRAKVHNNYVHDNNLANFGEPGTVVANVPAGTGVLVLAADDVELHDNRVENNDSTAFLLVSLETLAVLGGITEDAETDPFMTGIYIHDNELSGNGSAPMDATSYFGVAPLEDVVWDGVESSGGTGDLCLSTEAPSFRNFHGAENISDREEHTTDAEPHQCEGSNQPLVSL